jgi:hypothetical protein
VESKKRGRSKGLLFHDRQLEASVGDNVEDSLQEVPIGDELHLLEHEIGSTCNELPLVSLHHLFVDTEVTRDNCPTKGQVVLKTIFLLDEL